MFILEDGTTVKLSYDKIAGQDEPLQLTCRKPDASGKLAKELKGIVKKHFMEVRNKKTKEIEPRFRPGHEEAYKVDVFLACVTAWNVYTPEGKEAPLTREYLDRVASRLPIELAIDLSRVARNQEPEECEIMESEDEGDEAQDVSGAVRPTS